jgi:hypothetical protein
MHERERHPAFHSGQAPLSLHPVRPGAENHPMRRHLPIVIALLFCFAGHAAFAGAIFVGPPPGLTGNDTGGIISYSPNLDRAAYREIATDWCARWGRLSHVTSMHLVYGDYVSFVCIDRPSMIH